MRSIALAIFWAPCSPCVSLAFELLGDFVCGFFIEKDFLMRWFYESVAKVASQIISRGCKQLNLAYALILFELQVRS